MSEKSKRSHRFFSAAFKQDAVDVVVKQGLLDQGLGGRSSNPSTTSLRQDLVSSSTSKHVTTQKEFDRHSDTEHPTNSKNNIRQNLPSKT